ncbi:sialate O-acetylesterase [Alienimonas chondri]|uniref:Sialate O-acetylesterase domain-containing protein n=1 Tax=Alienimonas chondri TaxID=2681879 RepID=A0ABX1VDP2_9PLAN|nr:sialate O-acetylesterase [Alienimonas chondri]NNJ26081.1 hypothetical protein [Alienimonas chondri]
MTRTARRLFACLSCWAVGATLFVTPLFAQETPAKGDGADPNRHIYLLIGQSNMAGRAPISEAEEGVVPRCFLFNAEGEWEPARNPFNRYSTIRKGLGMQKMNPGYGFAQAMLEQAPFKRNEALTLGLVVNAKGGTRIEQWAKGTEFYNEAVRRTKAAAKTGALKGVLWHQGEGNSGQPAGYLDKLNALIANLREDLDAPDLPFIAGQIREGEAINDEIARLPQTTPHTGFVSSKGLTLMDKAHFDAPSMKRLGERYAQAISKLHVTADAAQDDGDAVSELNDREVLEAEVNASVEDVWAAFTTTDGLKSWVAPLADIDLRVGGKWRANYNEDGELGDATTIENTILSYDPERMLSLKATGFPEGFPFADAAEKSWSVLYFTPVTESKTKITVVGLGYDDTEQSRKMRAYFRPANQHLMTQLKATLEGAAAEQAE